MGLTHPLDYRNAPKIVSHYRSQGKKVVLARGTFDIFNLGHLDFLSRAKDLGHILMVNVNSDLWVINRKGIKPARDEIKRAMLVGGQEPVDYVFVHPSNPPYDIHPAIELAIESKPNILVREDKDPEFQELEKKILMEHLGPGDIPEYHALPRSTYSESSSEIKQAIIDQAKEEIIRKALAEMGIYDLT